MKIRQIILLNILIILLSCSDKDSPINPNEENNEYGFTIPRKEIRAVWMATVSNIDWPKNKSDIETQKKEYTDYLDLFKQYNVNAVVMQIRPCADAFYDSPLEPWSEFITGTQGKNPGYDVLRFMIDEAHKRGLEFHAWMNPFRISNNKNTFRPASNHIYNTHPEWTMTYDKLLMFRPGIPEARDFFINVVDDLISKYDIDGIHFDDYFYPYPKKGFTIDDEGDFSKYGKDYTTIEDFRRGNVNKIIEAVHNLIIKKRPDIIFSISPYGIWRNIDKDKNGSQSSGLSNYDDLYADVRLWCEKGWIDLVVPQLYASTENVAMNFIKMTNWWIANSYDCPVAIGHGLYRFGNIAEGQVYMNPMQLEMQFFYARRHLGIKGSFLYNASVFKENKIDILSTLLKMYEGKSLIPFLGRATAALPLQISKIQNVDGTISWNSQENMRYVVYKIKNDTAQIVDITNNPSYKYISTGDYCVSALNSDNMESKLSSIITIN